MEKTIQNQNLVSLIEEFRNEGRAAEAFNELKKDLTRTEFLEVVLRDHRRSPITNQQEIQYRDRVDFLLKYYSLLELGRQTGYLPESLTPAIKKEVTQILGNYFVKQYYQTIYPLLLPQMLYNWAIGFDTVKVSKDHADKFAELLMLDSLLDDDVEYFLWMLDDGISSGRSMYDLNEVLKSRDKVGELLGKSREDEDPLDHSFWGFIKFTDYMVRYQRLLREVNHRIVRSALWHYQAYWFVNMKEHMQDRYIHAIRLIGELQSNISFEEFAQTNTYEDLRVAHRQYEQWKIDAAAEVNRVIAATEELLDEKNGQPLKEVMRDTYYRLTTYKTKSTARDIKSLLAKGPAVRVSAFIISDQKHSNISEILKPMDIACTVITPGVAVTKLPEETPQLIFLDVHMPQKSTVVMVDRIKSFYSSSEKNPSIIVVNRNQNYVYNTDNSFGAHNQQTDYLITKINDLMNDKLKS